MGKKIQSLLNEAARETALTGGESSSKASAKREFTSVSEAEINFEKLKDKLFYVESWNEYSGVTSFGFFDENGKHRPDKKAETGDYIKVTLPGTGKPDWVKIVEIHEAPDEVLITVQPSKDPTSENPGENTLSHFFTDDSRNSFCLERTDKFLKCYVIGIHEKTNTENTSGILETARNFATSNLGHYLGVQHLEWTVFCRNLLDIPENESEKPKVKNQK